MFEALVDAPYEATAVYIFPTKALAQDQQVNPTRVEKTPPSPCMVLLLWFVEHTECTMLGRATPGSFSAALRRHTADSI